MKPENIYQKKFSQKTAPINKDALWNKIASNPEFPSKPSRSSWWLSVPFLFILALAGFCYQSPLDPISKLSTINDVPLVETEYENPRHDDQISTALPVENLTDSDESIFSKNTPSQNNVIENSIVNNISSAKKQAKSSTSLQDHNHQNLTSLLDQVQNSSNSILSDKIKAKKTLSLDLNQIEKNNPLFINPQNDSSSRINFTNSKTSETEERSKMAENSLDLAFSKLLIEPLNFKQFKLKSIKESDVFTKKSWLLTFNMGIGQSQHELISLDGDKEGITALRNENVQNLETQLISLSLSRDLVKRFRFTLEGEYVNAFQKFNYKITESKLIRNINPSDGFYSNETTNTQYQLYHSYKLFQTNILLERAFRLNVFEATIGMGISINNYFSPSGKIITLSSDILEISDFNAYGKRGSISYLLNAGVSYSINESHYLSCSFRYRSATKLTKENANISHSLSTLSSSIGIAYKF